MPQPLERSFGTIESALEFMSLLEGAVLESQTHIQREFDEVVVGGDERRQHALRLALYKIARLHHHVHTTHRLLNDLRTLRRLLHEERASAIAGTAV